MKATAIIQARMGSSRLPGKILIDLSGKNVLKHVYDRAASCKNVDKVIVATTISRRDDAVVQFCKEAGLPFFRGSEEDVLDRYYQCAQSHNASQIIRITADCPVLDPDIVDQIVTLHFSRKADYTSNTIHPTFPDGLDAEVFSLKLLEQASQNATLKSDREHVTPYIKNRPSEFRLCEFLNDEDLSSKRWTLDTPKDFEFLKILFSNLYQKSPLFGMKKILDYLQVHPETELINQGIVRNEGYAESLKEDKKN